MIKFENHVPDVYVTQSRDFQLFVAIFDYFQNAIKFRIDKVEDICDTRSIQDSLIPYLQEKLGFFTATSVSSNQLRTLLRTFSTIVRNKGSKAGILIAVNTFLNSQHKLARAAVTIDASENVVYIATTSPIEDRNLLEELLQYVVPAGYKIAYSLLTSSSLVWKQTVSNIIASKLWTYETQETVTDYGKAIPATTVLDQDDKNDAGRTVNTTLVAELQENDMNDVEV